jgi:hypothetical protein
MDRLARPTIAEEVEALKEGGRDIRRNHEMRM